MSLPRNSDTRQRIQRALRFVRKNLHQPIRTSELARVAAYSEHHFHRLFLAETGERVGQFVTRSRLESAARMLAYEPDRSVTEIALCCGYSSNANFSKAFSRFFGVSPSSVRSPNPQQEQLAGVLKEQYHKNFHPAQFYSDSSPGSQKRLERLQQMLRMEERSALHLACMSGPGGYALSSTLELWECFSKRLLNLGLWNQESQMYGILHDDPVVTHEDHCRYDAGLSMQAPLAEVPAPLFLSTIPAGRFAIFHFQGSISQLNEVYRDIYSLWFPESGLTPDSFPPVEHYLTRGPDAQGQFSLELQFKTRQTRSS